MSEPVEFLHLVGAQINEALGVGGPASEAKFDHAFVGFERLAPYLGNVADVVLDLLRERGAPLSGWSPCVRPRSKDLGPWSQLLGDPLSGKPRFLGGNFW